MNCKKCGMNEEGLIQELVELHERNCKGKVMSAVDEAITRITDAKDDTTAMEIASRLGHRLLFAVADQLYVDAEGHGTQWVRNAVVKEARA